MKRSISNTQFILLFSHVIFIAHTFAEPSEAVVKELFASHQRNREARLSARNLLQVANNNQDEAWAGAYQSTEPPSGTFNSVTATWIISSISLPEGAKGQGEWGISQWVGIDGVGTCKNALFQAGIFYFISTDDEGKVVETGTVAVYEWYPASMVITDYKVAEGDMIKVFVQATSPSDGVVVFTNPTTDAKGAFTVSAPGPDSNLCGNTVEWIVELPKKPEDPWQLPNFGKIYLQNCFGTRMEGPSVDLHGATVIDLIDKDSNLLAKSVLESDTELSVEYKVGK